ncbi:MAG: hypothetical protein NC355_07645 [Blautia sp.]|nr:hypothetical protein [Blautia sp.]
MFGSIPQFYNTVDGILANMVGSPIVPIVNYVYDPTMQINCKLNPIHTIIDEPIDITNLSEKEGLKRLRDVMATWYYLMMEKYGSQIRRKEMLDYYYERYMKNCWELRQKPMNRAMFSTHSAFEIYLKDLNSIVAWYDSKIETSYDFRSKEIHRPEDVFEPITHIQNVTPQNIGNVLAAVELVQTRSQEDYQRRF